MPRPGRFDQLRAVDFRRRSTIREGGRWYRRLTHCMTGQDGPTFGFTPVAPSLAASQGVGYSL